MSKADAGDLQILGADFRAKRFQGGKTIRCIVIPRKDQPRGEYLDLPYQALIGGNLIPRFGLPPNRCKPATERLLDRDCRNRRVFLSRFESLEQS